MFKLTTTKSASPGAGNGRKKTFSLAAPVATKVQLVGDFTDWCEHPIDMKKTPNGVWRAPVELQPGMHQYRFLVDGQWQDDPDCLMHAPNPFGSQNAVCQVA